MSDAGFNRRDLRARRRELAHGRRCKQSAGDRRSRYPSRLNGVDEAEGRGTHCVREAAPVLLAVLLAFRGNSCRRSSLYPSDRQTAFGCHCAESLSVATARPSGCLSLLPQSLLPVSGPFVSPTPEPNHFPTQHTPTPTSPESYAKPGIFNEHPGSML